MTPMPKPIRLGAIAILVVGFNISAWLLMGAGTVIVWFLELWAAFTLRRRSA